LPRAQLRIWLYRIPSLIGAIGAVLLTYWAALAFVTRRGAALAALMMCSCVLLGAEARLAKTDAMLLLTVVAAMGAMARVYLSWQRGEDPERPPWTSPAIVWTPLAGMAVAAAPGLGPDVDAGAGAAVVRRDLLARRRGVLLRFARRRHAEQARRAGIPWRAARPLSAAVLDHVLAGRGAGGNGSARGMACAARARCAISAGVAGAVLDRIRTGADQAAALRAAALSGDCDPHRGRAGAPRFVALLADAWCGLVVRHSGGRVCDRRHRRHQADALPGVSGLAVPGGGDDIRPDRVVDVRGQPRRALA